MSIKGTSVIEFWQEAVLIDYSLYVLIHMFYLSGVRILVCITFSTSFSMGDVRQMGYFALSASAITNSTMLVC